MQPKPENGGWPGVLVLLVVAALIAFALVMQLPAVPNV